MREIEVRLLVAFIMHKCDIFFVSLLRMLHGIIEYMLHGQYTEFVQNQNVCKVVQVEAEKRNYFM